MEVTKPEVSHAPLMKGLYEQHELGILIRCRKKE